MSEEQLNAIMKAIQKEVGQSNEILFSYAWREKLGEIGNFLMQESRYVKLVEWIDKELEMEKKTIAVFCPCDKDENYTNSYFNTYLKAIQKVGVLTHLRELLLASRSTTTMRDNIEYTLCKIYNIKYSEELKDYIYESKELE